MVFNIGKRVWLGRGLAVRTLVTALHEPMSVQLVELDAAVPFHDRGAVALEGRGPVVEGTSPVSIALVMPWPIVSLNPQVFVREAGSSEVRLKVSLVELWNSGAVIFPNSLPVKLWDCKELGSFPS